MINMDSGTLCDLNGKPRITRVHYVCYPAGKHEIFSLEEASTCEYEIVVLTPYLCQHPDYRFKPLLPFFNRFKFEFINYFCLIFFRAKESEENKINCWPVEGAPKKPSSLVDIEAESVMLQQQQNLLDSLGLSDAKFKVEFRQVDDVTGQGLKQTVAFITPTGGSTGKEKSPNPDMIGTEAEPGANEMANSRLQPPPTTQPVFDPKLVEDFLAGEYCLNGVRLQFIRQYQFNGNVKICRF